LYHSNGGGFYFARDDSDDTYWGIFSHIPYSGLYSDGVYTAPFTQIINGGISIVDTNNLQNPIEVYGVNPAPLVFSNLASTITGITPGVIYYQKSRANAISGPSEYRYTATPFNRWFAILDIGNNTSSFVTNVINNKLVIRDWYIKEHDSNNYLWNKRLVRGATKITLVTSDHLTGLTIDKEYEAEEVDPGTYKLYQLVDGTRTQVTGITKIGTAIDDAPDWNANQSTFTYSIKTEPETTRYLNATTQEKEIERCLEHFSNIGLKNVQVTQTSPSTYSIQYYRRKGLIPMPLLTVDGTLLAEPYKTTQLTLTGITSSLASVTSFEAVFECQAQIDGHVQTVFQEPVVIASPTTYAL
jgi:hypothetical protein